MEQILKKLAIKDYTDHTSDDFLPPDGSIFRQESHDAREILLVISGTMDFHLAGKRFAATPGKAFFINSWIPHQLGYGKLDCKVEHIWVHLHAKRMFAMSHSIADNVTLPSPGMREFPSSMLELINLYWQRAEKSPAEQRKKLYNAIIRMICDEMSFQSANTASVKQKDDDVSGWVKNYISMNYGRNSSLETLEQLTGFNRRHLMRKFKNECGMTIGEYINCVRRGFAAVAGKRLSQKEIAFQLGFQSPAAYWLWKNRDRKKFSGNKNPAVQPE